MERTTLLLVFMFMFMFMQGLRLVLEALWLLLFRASFCSC